MVGYRVKFLGALALILLGGSLIAWRVVQYSRPSAFPPEHESQHQAPSAAPEGEPPTLVESYVTPTAETLHSLVQEVATMARRAGVQDGQTAYLSEKQKDALFEMFTEHFEYALSGADIETYDKWISVRGGDSRHQAAIDAGHERAYRRDIEGRAQFYKFLSIVPDGVKVLERYRNGVLIPWDRQPVAGMYTDPNTFGIPMDAEKAKLTVYEIRIPAMIPGIPANPVTGAPIMNATEIFMPGVLSLAYAWDEARGQWFPWRNWVYCSKCDGHEFYDGPNFP